MGTYCFRMYIRPFMKNTGAMDQALYQCIKHESNQEVILKLLEKTSGMHFKSHHLSWYPGPLAWRTPSQTRAHHNNEPTKYWQTRTRNKMVKEWACKPDSVRDETHFIPWRPFLWNLGYPRLQATYPRTSTGPVSLPVREEIAFFDKPGIVPLFGFAPGDAYPATCVTTGAVGSYPTISPLPGKNKGICHWRYIFCGAGVGLLRLGVTQHLTLWSPDFPLTKISVSGHPAHSHHQ